MNGISTYNVHVRNKDTISQILSQPGGMTHIHNAYVHIYLAVYEY